MIQACTEPIVLFQYYLHCQRCLRKIPISICISIQSNQLLYKSQYGFRKGHSTNLAIIELVSNIIQGFEENNYTVAVFMHLSKAFDTIDHEILLKKLENYGARGLPLD